ncbi:MAG: segregation/condensation protein A [Gemella haemolysans]|uniref:segregation and condensation protein A n=1 Tax=Gemella haemolysans TaxID=1379 RepID=UPI00290A0EA0|nr:segregation/condensation protein A [Gemella haemolysans]MDU6572784.1 segregation/condensation protein A [Gemella haemolysans]
MYNVNLEVFQGPLDLLLHLIEKMEIDIYNIPIAKLTESYLEYINNNDDFSLENAEEYIVMAATLLHIKSKNLLPKFENETIEDEEDLVQQLLDYKNYKELSEKLDNLQRMRAQFLDKESINLDVVGSVETLRMPSSKLLRAMENILRSFDENENEISLVSYRREVSFEEVKEELVNKFKNKTKMNFFDLVRTYSQKNEIVLMFIGVLAMIKDQELQCVDKDGEIILEYKSKED